jgi:hypothetical protein
MQEDHSMAKKNLFTKHAFQALTRADCLKSLNLWPLVTELHGKSNRLVASTSISP